MVIPEFGTAAATHCAAALMAHAGEPVTGSALPSLAETDQDRDKEQQAKRCCQIC